MSKKPTLELSPTVSEAATKVDNVVVDARGRTLKIVPPDVLTESRLVRALGHEASLNAAYMGAYVLPAVSVVEIDGEPMDFPMTQRQVDASIQILGREGIDAVIKHMAEKIDAKDQASAEVKN